MIKKAKAPPVDSTTAARSLQAAGFDVKARKPREKPMRTPDHEALRVALCKKWKQCRKTYVTKNVDLIMDNKRWEIPMSRAGQRYANMRKVRFVLRTRGEGLAKGFTKPSVKKQRVNVGGFVNFCAGIINCKVSGPNQVHT